MKAMFAAGCFWSVEEAFRRLDGVSKTAVGYSGGAKKNPSYEDVCTDRTGHAEAVLLEYDPKIISYDELLDTFWTIHDPTQVNRQGPDVGTQYRSAIFYFNEMQKKTAIASAQELENAKKHYTKIVTQIVPATVFYPAEEYHQKYLMKRSLNVCN